jgi:putative membrane protein
MPQDVSQPRVTAASESGNIATELASRRTGMSFQRTRMSLDSTLLCVIRTALALIGFGFAIDQLLRRLPQSETVPGSGRGPGILGAALVTLGILVLALGIVYHVRFLSGLRDTRNEMTGDGLIRGQAAFPPSLVLITAVLLLLLGLGAIVGIVFHAGPFG